MNSEIQHPKHEHEDEHDKKFKIIVNGQEMSATGKELTFEQVVDLAFPGLPQGAGRMYTVTYRRGDGNKPEGSLVAGELVKIKEGMIFNVTPTDKS
jgi:hypothetical protein